MFTTLQTAVSGMNAAQVALSTTGHNIANIGTTGYSRQRVVSTDSYYRTVGVNGNGTFNQLGMGVSVTGIQQVRDVYLDAAYRTESTKLSYYAVKTGVGQYVESVTGEMDGSYSIQDAINELWDSMQEAVQYPESLDKRASLVSTATLFMDTMSNAWDDLQSYQYNLNNQVIAQVDQLNSLAVTIRDLNKAIIAAEMNGDNANDMRDALAVALEELNDIVPVQIEERANGRIDVYINDQPLISNGLVSPIGLKYTDEDSGLVEPVFTSRTDIIGYSEDTGKSLFKLDGSDDDNGSLLALLVTRGLRSETYASTPVAPDPADYADGLSDSQYQADYTQYKRDLFNITSCTIPSAMKQLDQIFNRVVTVINDALAPQDHDESTAPVGIDDAGTQFFELFTRVSADRYDEDGNYLEEDALTTAGEYPDRSTLYTIANCQINPDLLELDGYKKLPLSANGDLGNPDAVVEALAAWDDAVIVFDDGSASYNISDGYNHVITMIATEVAADATNYEGQLVLTTQIDNYRQAVMGVSSDEEMSNMLIYQRSYQAAAKVINIVDSMIDTIINGMI